VNGIAIGILELKNSRTSPGDGIRQSLSNQQPEFNAWLRHGAAPLHRHDSEGLQYGTISPGEILPEVEGRRSGQQPFQAGQTCSECAARTGCSS
jgi:hypothetical protein